MNIKDEESIDSLIYALRDEDYRVVINAADAIGVIAHPNDKTAVDALIFIAQNQNIDIANHGLSALERLGVADKIPALKEKRFPKLLEDYKKSRDETRRRLANNIMKYDFEFMSAHLKPNDITRLALDADIYGGFVAIRGVSRDVLNSDPKISAPHGWSEVLGCIPAIATDDDIKQLVRRRGSKATQLLMIAMGARCIPFLLPTLVWSPSPTAYVDSIFDQGALAILAEIGDLTCIPAIEDLGRKSSYVAADCKSTVERIRKRMETITEKSRDYSNTEGVEKATASKVDIRQPALDALSPGRILWGRECDETFAQDHMQALAWFDSQSFSRPMRGDSSEAGWFWDMANMAFTNEIWKEAWAGGHYSFDLYAKQASLRECARCLWRLGVIYKRMGSHELSRVCLTESLAQNRELADDKAIAIVLYELGEAHLLCKDAVAAEPILSEAVERLANIDPQAQQDARRLLEGLQESKAGPEKSAAVFLREARMHEKGGNLKQAADLFIQAAEVGTQEGDEAVAGDAGYFGHFLLLKLGRKEDAAKVLEISCTANKKVGRKYELGAGLARLGRILVDLGQKERAKTIFQECLDVLKDARSPEEDLADVKMRLAQL